MDLQGIANRLEIAELLARYARGLDTKDWDLWRSVFVEDAYIDYRSAGGIDGHRNDIAAWLEKTFAMTAERAAEVADRSSGSFARAIELKEEQTETLDITDYSVDEFFALLNSSNFRKEGRLA